MQASALVRVSADPPTVQRGTSTPTHSPPKFFRTSASVRCTVAACDINPGPGSAQIQCIKHGHDHLKPVTDGVEAVFTGACPINVEGVDRNLLLSARQAGRNESAIDKMRSMETKVKKTTLQTIVTPHRDYAPKSIPLTRITNGSGSSRYRRCWPPCQCLPTVGHPALEHLQSSHPKTRQATSILIQNNRAKPGMNPGSEGARRDSSGNEAPPRSHNRKSIRQVCSDATRPVLTRRAVLGR